MPSKMTDEVLDDLEKAIRLGASRADAAAFAGISESTFYAWMAKGKTAKRGKMRAVYVRLKQAEARGRVGLLAKIELAANNGDWRAAAWKLERRDPENYGTRQINMRHAGEKGGPVQVESKVAFVAELPGVAAGAEEWQASVENEQAERIKAKSAASSGAPNLDPNPG